MIKLVAFDWNGTILADAQATLEGANKELEVLGRPPMTMHTFRRYHEMPVIKFYENMGVKPEAFKAKSEAIATAFHTYYEPRAAKARTRTGARDVLSYLHAHNVKQVVISNHTTEGIYLQLERLKLGHYFDAILANGTIIDANLEGKEKRLSSYITENNLTPSEVAIVGDTVEEVIIGKALGLRTISITGGYDLTQRLQAAKPDSIINSLTKLVSALEEL